MGSECQVFFAIGIVKYYSAGARTSQREPSQDTFGPMPRSDVPPDMRDSISRRTSEIGTVSLFRNTSLNRGPRRCGRLVQAEPLRG